SGVPASPTEALPSLTPTLPQSPTLRATATQTLLEPTLTPVPTNSRPATYTLQKGEYPYCIARRFNLDPGELLALNKIQNGQTFFAGTVLQIPQSGNPFPGERILRAHPTAYMVTTANQTIYTIACEFGDLDPQTIAQANNISVDSALFRGEQLNIP
ncbi:MAG TPA: LysM peptidoglycan-binding domain-containing protein, partial [Anaerolineales bacterium]|nr:LysM peptidoglycan-binding domain-containing protein [Anaerolineales bacterium]